MYFFPPALEAAAVSHSLESSVKDFCREVGRQMDPRIRMDPQRIRALRNQAAELLPVCARILPKENPTLALLNAAIGVMDIAAGQDGPGERRFGTAAKALAQRWKDARKKGGGIGPECLAEMENLGVLYELGGLRSTIWRDEALRARVGGTRLPNPDLEKDLAAAVEDHYGPWLTTAEIEPMLEFCGHLARAWGSYRDDRTLTRRVLILGLQPQADRVWKLAAQRASQALRDELASVLGRLDAGEAVKSGEEACEGLVDLGKALMGTSLDGAARDLLNRLDARLGSSSKSAGGELRRRIAKLLGEEDRVVGLLAEALEAADTPKVLGPLLQEAEAVLRARPQEELLRVGSRRLEASAHHPKAWGTALSPRLKAWSGLQARMGHLEEAEALDRLRLEIQDSQPSESEDGQGPEKEPPALLKSVEDLERALRILEEKPEGSHRAIAGIYTALAQMGSLDGDGLERNLLRILGSLENLPILENETAEWARELPGSFVALFWREQRFDGFFALGPRLQGLLCRVSADTGVMNRGSSPQEFEATLREFARLGRIQALLRGAGLP